MANIRGQRSKCIISMHDKEVELIRLGVNGEVCSEADSIKGLYRNCLGMIYAIIDDSVCFISDDILKKFSVKIVEE